jgi:tetratricopeptide (TPR) repeat protein
MKTLALASVVLMAGLAASAHAQTATGVRRATDVQPGAEAAADHEAAASALVEQAARAYDQNQFDEALQLLARAFALSPRPSILYNQAQVLRAKDDCVAALDAYRRFIEATAPDDPDRERALRRRDEMQACADQRASRTTPPAPAAAPPAQALPAVVPPALAPPAPAPAVLVVSTPVPPEDHPVDHRRALRVAGWAAIGVGVVAAGVAAAYAWEAHHIQGELQSYLNTAPQQNALWPPTQQSEYQEGTRDASRAWWCVGAAALAGGGGGALLILSRPPAAAGAVAGTPSEPHVALIGWSGTF